EPAGLVGEIEQDGARLHQRLAGVVVDDGRDLVVGTDLQELRRELVVLADVDGMGGVVEAGFFEKDRDLAAVGRGPCVEIDHRELLDEGRVDAARQVPVKRGVRLSRKAATPSRPSALCRRSAMLRASLAIWVSRLSLNEAASRRLTVP